VAHVIRPFNSRPPNEIVAAPKVYGFDTNFVCYYHGWQELRDEDLGLLVGTLCSERTDDPYVKP